MEPLILSAALFTVAMLYAAVGHGGASGYLAVMALAAMTPETMRPTALLLNLCVSLLGTICFLRAGCFRPRLFLLLALGSVPAAFVGGLLALSHPVFNMLLAASLAFAAWRLLWKPPQATGETNPHPLLLAALGIGIGLLSGLVGVGGGIFLTPLLIMFRWCDPKTAAALSAPFIFVNSAAGLLGRSFDALDFAPELPWMIPAVLLGGLLGALWGSRHAVPRQLRLVLAGVLLIACVKLLLP